MNDREHPAVPARYVDGRRLLLGAMRVGVDLVALLVVDSLASRVQPAVKGRSPRHAAPAARMPSARMPAPPLPAARRLELVRPA